MEVKDLALPGLKLITFEENADEPGDDDRGVFTVAWRRRKLAREGLETPDWEQFNFVRNTGGALRAWHAEPWGKYVCVVFGSAWGAWVDLRPDSPTFGQAVMHLFDAYDAVYVPPGFGNGYYARYEDTIYVYFTTKEWEPGKYPNVRWNDPDIIDVTTGKPFEWPMEGVAFHRIKKADREAPLLRDLFPDHPRFSKH